MYSGNRLFREPAGGGGEGTRRSCTHAVCRKPILQRALCTRQVVKATGCFARYTAPRGRLMELTGSEGWTPAGLQEARV